jgi:MscS family membrane protein
MPQIFDTVFGENTVMDYSIAILILLGFIVGGGIIQFIVLRGIKKLTARTKTKIDDSIHLFLKHTVLFSLVVLGIVVAMEPLTMPEGVKTFINHVAQIVVIIKVTHALTVFLSDILEQSLSPFLQLKTGLNTSLIRLLSRLIKIALWIIAITLIMNIFNYDITAIITGLGIGGLAIALAAQDTLGNFFSSVSIIMDKPFKIGQVVSFDGHEGQIADVGMRTTRIKSFFDTEIIVPNSVLAKTIVENVSRRRHRRSDMNLALVYDTPNKKIKEAMKIINDILKKDKEITNDYIIAFDEYMDSSLNLKIIWYAKDPSDYAKYLKLKTKVNLAIKEGFEKAEVEFAYPTQTIHLQK